MKQIILPMALLLAGTALAQVSETTPDQLSGIPQGFLPTAKTPNFAPHGTPKGYKVNPDPRDFTASYISGGGGGPGGPPPGGGAPPGGAPGGGAPGGGTPGGAPPPGAGQGIAENNTGPTKKAGAPPCIPSFNGGPYASHMISSPGRLTVVNEYNHTARRFFIGGQHLTGAKPTYMGDSIGHWDGNTLVTDTTALRELPGVDIKERWSKQANGSIKVDETRFDAAGKPTGEKQTTIYTWRPDISYVEDMCEDFGEAFGNDYGSPTGKAP